MLLCSTIPAAADCITVAASLHNWTAGGGGGGMIFLLSFGALSFSLPLSLSHVDITFVSKVARLSSTSLIESRNLAHNILVLSVYISSPPPPLFLSHTLAANAGVGVEPVFCFLKQLTG